MRHLPLKAAATLAVLASTCGLAHAADQRPQALPANLLFAAARHDAAPGFRDAILNLERPDLRHDADDDGHDRGGHDKDDHEHGHHHHPCTPE